MDGIRLGGWDWMDGWMGLVGVGCGLDGIGYGLNV